MSAANRALAGLSAGNEIAVDVERDVERDVELGTEPRDVVVPADFAATLDVAVLALSPA